MPDNNPVNNLRQPRRTDHPSDTQFQGHGKLLQAAAHRRPAGMPAGGQRLTSFGLHALTVLCALLAAAILLVTEADGRRLSTAMQIELALTTIGVVALAVLVRRRVAAMPEQPVVMPLLLILVAASLLWEPVQRFLFSSGRPFELLVMFSQKNLMLGLAIFGFWPGYQRLSLLIGVFLTIFCAVISHDRTVHLMIACYGISSIVWLVVGYWDMLKVRLLAAEKSAMPAGWLVASAAVPMLLLAAMGSKGNAMLTAVEGFLPGSGGTGNSDPFSRGGVNDGDGLVAGSQNIKSFAPIDDAPFAEDSRPSLYDVFSDVFDEPVRRTQQQERSVALPPELMGDVRQRMARSRQAGREFSTLRTTKKPDTARIADLSSSALFYVAGRVPLHLKMELYDVFDGLEWTPEDFTGEIHGMAMARLNGRPWLRIPCGSRGLELYTGTETHAVKVINLRSSVIPCPPDTRGIHIDKVEQADMFALHQDGIVRMTRKSLPELQSIHLMSERVAYAELSVHTGLMKSGPPDPLHLQLPSTLHMQAVSELARKWTAGIPRGWSQVEAIMSRLQAGYQLDRQARPAADCQFPVGEFLFRSRRGPEYLFASSTALMLRSLGYPTRLVSGFYAHPEKHDARQRHTAVLAEDAHFWCEVYVGARTWLTVEASPGYQVLQPPPDLRQRVILALKQLLAWSLRHWLPLTTAAAILLLVWRNRRRLADSVLTALWTIHPLRTPRGRALQTLRLLDHRLRAAGVPRPAGVSLNRWLKLQPALSELSPALPDFLQLVDWAAFAETDDETAERQQVADNCCRRVRHEFTLRSISRAMQRAGSVA